MSRNFIVCLCIFLWSAPVLAENKSNKYYQEFLDRRAKEVIEDSLGTLTEVALDRYLSAERNNRDVEYWTQVTLLLNKFKEAFEEDEIALLFQMLFVLESDPSKQSHRLR